MTGNQSNCYKEPTLHRCAVKKQYMGMFQDSMLERIVEVVKFELKEGKDREQRRLRSGLTCLRMFG